jgi:hypothetical protein
MQNSKFAYHFAYENGQNRQKTGKFTTLVGKQGFRRYSRLVASSKLVKREKEKGAAGRGQ